MCTLVIQFLVGTVHGQYLAKARKLDTDCFSSEPDLEARPVLRILRAYPRVRGQCVGAFAECSSDIHLLLRERRPRALPYATGAKLEPFLWRRRSRSTRIGTEATGVLN